MHDDSIVLVPLTQGKFSTIDAEDAERVLEHQWHVVNGYARSGSGVYMHRLINETPDGALTDHKNLDRSDNRKANLRTVGDAVSLHRRNAYGSSGFRGVFHHADFGSFSAKIGKDGVVYDLGYYRSAEEAALAYNEKAIELYGGDALLNVVDDTRVERMGRLSRGHNAPSGQRHGMAKLTAEDVRDIRARKAAGARGIGVQLAREYGISYTHLKRILGGKSWL